MDNKALIKKNGERWSKAVFDPASLTNASSVARRLVKCKDRYLAVSNRTGVPWYIIAVIHERESSQRWDRSIAQGDRWDRPSTHVPKGRGPFTSFEDAAYDALVNCAPHASQWKDWSAGGALTILELYNGIGYENKGIASPYIWSGTNQYTSGKYVKDGVFDVNVVDSQLGCATLIKAMGNIDEGVSFNKIVSKKPTSVPPLTDEQKAAVNAPKAGPVTNPDSDTKPAVQSTTIWTSIAGILTVIGAGVVDVIQKAAADWKVLAIFVVAGIFGYIIWTRSQAKDIKGIVS